MRWLGLSIPWRFEKYALTEKSLQMNETAINIYYLMIFTFS